jgi:hypothetical protein
MTFAPGIDWEAVSRTQNVSVDRLLVPGGWIYKVTTWSSTERPRISIVYVPEPPERV